MIQAAIVWSFKDRPSVFERSIRTASRWCPDAVRFLCVDGGSSILTLQHVRAVGSTIPQDLRVVEGWGTTLPQAWNLGLYLSATSVVVFASADVEFLRGGWLQELVEACTPTQPYVLLQNHAVFALHRQTAVREWGWFDEQFGNGPHFDCDYMIRADEAGFRAKSLTNKGYYKHGDTLDERRARLRGPQPGRLPMHTTENEDTFKRKWQTSWAGWTPNHTPHPPTRIGSVKRLRPEVDCHPGWTHEVTVSRA